MNINSKDYLLDKLIRLEVSNYRRIGLLTDGKYKREPLGYFQELRGIYSQLNKDDIKQLINIKPKSCLLYTSDAADE